MFSYFQLSSLSYSSVCNYLINSMNNTVSLIHWGGRRWYICYFRRQKQLQHKPQDLCLTNLLGRGYIQRYTFRGIKKKKLHFNLAHLQQICQQCCPMEKNVHHYASSFCPVYLKANKCLRSDKRRVRQAGELVFFPSETDLIIKQNQVWSGLT